MPVFPDTNVYYKGRTNTMLVVSEGDAPAEKYIPSAAEAVKFQYEFGPEGNQNVVLPKGKIVTFAGLEYDIETEKHIPAIKISDGTTAPLGVNHHNVYERKRDKFSGNLPTVITREYIRLPLFYAADAPTAEGYADSIKFGAAWTTDPETLYGKYVKSDSHGNFCVSADPANEWDKIVGQVYGVEKDIPPAGFLQYFMEMTDNQYLDFLKTSGYNIPSPGRNTSDANTLSIDTFPVGTGYLKSREDLSLVLKNFRAGIPFLTDGYFKARVEKTYANLADASVLDIRTMGGVTVGGDAEKLVTVSDYVGSAIFIRIKEKFCTDGLRIDPTTGILADTNHYPEYQGSNPASIKVFTTDTAGANPVEVSPANIHVDYYNNLIVVYFNQNITSKAIKVQATVLENQVPGIPTNWDFKNCVGEARILLKR